MASVTYENASLTYPGAKAPTVNGINLEIADGEFLVLVGPSGCGKSTTLRMLAGLEEVTGGRILIGDKDVTNAAPKERDIAMVFQNYALYPHMTVYDNIASPMRSPLHRKDEASIKEQVGKIAGMMGIGSLLERLPSQLSNGQRQRTAIGRCLVRSPRVFLMDEPLAHLDAKLRHLMRTELKSMQAEFDTTTIYVTHDYTEAMSLSDRVGIINEGEIIQIGSGDEIYYTPVNEFVAKLVGEPEINIIEIDLFRRDGRLHAVLRGNGHSFPVEDDVAEALSAAPNDSCSNWHMGIRGINVGYSFTETGNSVEGTVYNLEPIGNKTILTIRTGDLFFQAVAKNDLQAELDSRIFLSLDMKNALFFNGDTGRFVARHNQSELVRGR